MLWAAAWLYEASNNQYYLNYLAENGDALGGTGWAMTEFGWDVKYAGVQTLVAKVTQSSSTSNYLDGNNSETRKRLSLRVSVLHRNLTIQCQEFCLMCLV